MKKQIKKLFVEILQRFQRNIKCNRKIFSKKSSYFHTCFNCRGHIEIKKQVFVIKLVEKNYKKSFKKFKNMKSEKFNFYRNKIYCNKSLHYQCLQRLYLTQFVGQCKDSLIISCFFYDGEIEKKVSIVKKNPLRLCEKVNIWIYLYQFILR